VLGIKKESFLEMLDNYSADIVIGCETWLNSSTLDNEIMPTNYIGEIVMMDMVGY